MAREATGGAFESRGKLYARVTVAPKKRAAVLVSACTTLEHAQRRAQELQGLVDKLRAAGHERGIAKTLDTAAPLDDDGVRKLSRLIDRVVDGKEPAPWELPALVVNGETFETFAKKYTSGDLAKLYPDHVATKRSSSTDASWLRKYVYPVIGSTPLAAITLDHFERVLREADDRAKTRRLRGGKTQQVERKLSSRSRQAIGQGMRRVMALAVYPAKLIAQNPIPENAIPRVRSHKLGRWLYPAEDAKLLASKKVDLGRRLLFGFLVRLGWRKGEAIGGVLEKKTRHVPPLTWGAIDLVAGVANLDKNKTDDPRMVPLGEDVVRALEAWKTMYPGKITDDAPVFVHSDGRPHDRVKLAHDLRADLQAAGVDRRELFVSTDTHDKIDVHDLRATFVTISLACDRSERWICDRTGHRSHAMIEKYRRPARAVAEIGLGAVAPLDQAIPELRKITAAGGGFSGSRRSARHSPKREIRQDSRSAPRKIRTSDNWFRRPVLYPAELWALVARPLGGAAANHTRGDCVVNSMAVRTVDPPSHGYSAEG